MSDSSGDEEATVCPDDQSIDVGIDDLTLDNRSGGKTAVPVVSPVDAQPPDEDDLSNRIPGVEDVLRCVRLSHHIKQLLHNSTYFKDVKKQEEIFEGVEYKQLWVELAFHLFGGSDTQVHSKKWQIRQVIFCQVRVNEEQTT